MEEDNHMTGRAEKRKATISLPLESERSIPVPPSTVGFPVQQISRDFYEAESSTLNNINPRSSAQLAFRPSVQHLPNSTSFFIPSGHEILPGSSTLPTLSFVELSRHDHPEISLNNKEAIESMSTGNRAYSFTDPVFTNPTFTSAATTFPAVNQNGNQSSGPAAVDGVIDDPCLANWLSGGYQYFPIIAPGEVAQRGTPPSTFNRLLENHDILFQVCRWLDAESMVTLYAISQKFHLYVNSLTTTIVVGNAQNRMPESAEVFPFKSYKSLCMTDAFGKTSNDKYKAIRDAPTLRWLRFIEYREATVNSIIRELAKQGLRLPRMVSLVLKKIWYMMDFPDTKRRIGLVHNRRIWTNSTLYVAAMFFMKLAMATTDPMLGAGERRIRQMLMAQRTLSITDRVLKRQMMRNQAEMLQMFTEWTVDPNNLVNAAMPLPPGTPELKTMFGVPVHLIGGLCCENWVPGPVALLRPDELVMREAVRRKLRFQDKLIDMMLWGNIHPVTGQDVYPTDWTGEVQVIFEDEVEDQVERDIEAHASPEGTQVDWEGLDDGEEGGEMQL